MIWEPVLRRSKARRKSSAFSHNIYGSNDDVGHDLLSAEARITVPVPYAMLDLRKSEILEEVLTSYPAKYESLLPDIARSLL